jgi:hypothetical protein
MNLRTLALPFDWIRISSNDLINILETKFQFFLENLYVERESNKFHLFDSDIIIKNYDLIINDNSKTLIIKNKNYSSLVFPHEINDIKDMPNFIEKYKRRINNFMNIINDKTIKKIFIRIDKSPLIIEQKKIIEKLLDISDISDISDNEIRYVTIDKNIKYKSWKKDEIDWISILQ